MTEFIRCKQIVKAYRVSEHEVVALRGIDFSMDKGEMVAIIGPSGAGKTSLLNLLGGLDTPTAGQLTVNGQNLLDLKGRKLADYRLKEVGFLWQQVERNLVPYRSALGNATLPMMLAGVSPWERRKRARELLETVGLGDNLKQRPDTLSGGQQQRVAVAVALANHPGLLLMDEPTGALDRESAVQVMNLIRDLRAKYGLTILMVTHDMDIAAHADRVLTLRDGALGQDLSQQQEHESAIDGNGRVRLPQAAQSHLAEAARISIEVRPEGVLLRPETDEVDDTMAVLRDILPQDGPPPRQEALQWLRRRLRRKRGPVQDQVETTT
jgi:ABC-type lipoprotein export system ATPase subunit